MFLLILIFIGIDLLYYFLASYEYRKTHFKWWFLMPGMGVAVFFRYSAWLRNDIVTRIKAMEDGADKLITEQQSELDIRASIIVKIYSKYNILKEENDNLKQELEYIKSTYNIK